MNENTHLT